MINKNFIYTNTIIIEEVAFKENNPPQNKPEELQIEDKLDYFYKNGKMSILVTRRVWFEPSSIFEGKVAVKTILDEKNDSDYDSSKITLENFMTDFGDAIDTVCSRISAIISSLTMATLNTPLITIPTLITKQK